MTKERSEMQTLNKTPAPGWLRQFAGAVIGQNPMQTGALAVLLGFSLTTFAAGADNRAPGVPPEIAVPVGNKVHFHGLGVGVQIYTWDGSSWGRAVPEATLFNGRGIVATHFAGPTWQSNSGSRVVGAVVRFAIVDRDSIPWLLLSAVPTATQGPGIFANTTYIQRVNTIGGKAPAEDGTFIGQVARVPYSADYFFYTDK